MSASNHNGRTELREVASQRFVGLRSKLDEHAPPVMGIGASDKEPLLHQRLEPPQRGGRWHRRCNAQARYRNAQLRDFRLEEVEHHIPCGIGEEMLRKIACA